MLYHKLIETTMIFSQVKVFLGNILLVEFSFSKSEGINYISKASDKCQEKLRNLYIYEEWPLKSR